jgi:glycosyltransferase involved in cell wall biosynthesis
VALHFLGNNPEHLFAYHSAIRWSGGVVCHDLMTPHLLGGFAPEEERLDLVEQLGSDGATAVLARRARGVATGDEAFFRQVSTRPLRRADVVIVHSRFAEFAVKADLPGKEVVHVPSHTGAVPRDIAVGPELRRRLGLPEDAFLVGMFGFLGGHKRVPQALGAVARAAPAIRAQGRRLGLVVVGAEVGMDVRAVVDDLGLTGVTTITGPIDDRSFFEHMAAIDVLVNLRYPTLGETSATMLQAMQLGKPVIVTDHAQFGEERAAIRIAPDEREAERVADALVKLATCPQCRDSITEAVTARAAEHSLDAAVGGYLEAVDLMLARN